VFFTRYSNFPASHHKSLHCVLLSIFVGPGNRSPVAANFVLVFVIGILVVIGFSIP